MADVYNSLEEINYLLNIAVIIYSWVLHSKRMERMRRRMF